MGFIANVQRFSDALALCQMAGSLSILVGVNRTGRYHDDIHQRVLFLSPVVLAASVITLAIGLLKISHSA
jgi:hypothetical protein